MGRTTKPGEPPDMRTLDDPEPPPIPKADGFITKDQITAGTITSGGAFEFQRATGYWRARPQLARPNAWRRFWTWALLGWTWEKIE